MQDIEYLDMIKRSSNDPTIWGGLNGEKGQRLFLDAEHLYTRPYIVYVCPSFLPCFDEILLSFFLTFLYFYFLDIVQKIDIIDVWETKRSKRPCCRCNGPKKERTNGRTIVGTKWGQVRDKL